MTLAEQLNQDMKAALKQGDKFRLATIRMALAAIQQQEVDTREKLDDAGVVRVIEKLIKRGKDAESQFRAGGREQQADQEAGEVRILTGYLPTQLSESEVDALIRDAIAATGATDMKDMGKIMGVLKAKAAGRVDMGAASKRVTALLNSR